MLLPGNSFAIFNFTIYSIINAYCGSDLSLKNIMLFSQ